jgi:hypothetical protein
MKPGEPAVLARSNPPGSMKVLGEARVPWPEVWPAYSRDTNWGCRFRKTFVFPAREPAEGETHEVLKSLAP